MKKSHFFYLFFLFIFVLGTHAQAVPPQKKLPKSCCPKGKVELYADWLYFVAQENGLEYLQSGRGPGSRDNLGDDFDGRIKKIDPSWKSGFRVALGYDRAQKDFDLLARWTRYEIHPTHSTEELSISMMGYMKNIHNLGDFWAFPVASKAFWKMEYDVADGIMGVPICIGKHLLIHPFFGVKGAWINNRFTVVNVYPGVEGYHLKTEVASDFSGGGLETGFDLFFELFSKLNLYAQAEGALIYGRFDGKYYLEEIPPAEDNPWSDITDHFNRAIGTVRLGIGLEYHRFFTCSEKAQYRIRIGWEENLWFGLNQMIVFRHRMGEGHMFKQNNHLSLQGLVAGLQVNF